MRCMLTATLLPLVIVLSMGTMTYNHTPTPEKPATPTKISDLSQAEKKEAFAAYIAGSCEYKGIELKGKVKFVDNWEDIKIKYVDNWADIHVKFVDNWPDECGKWKEVDNWEDFKVKVVDNWEDLKVKKVDNWPGMQ